MGVDIIDLLRRDVRISDCSLNGAAKAIARWVGGDDVVTIGSLRPADDLCDDGDISAAGVFKFFKHKNGCSAGADKSIALHVKSARAKTRIGLNAEGAKGGKEAAEKGGKKG